MPENGHKPDFPAQTDIAGFLKTLGKHDDVSRAADIPSSTYAKWHQSDPAIMSAENLLRVVVALGAEKRFYEWLRGFRGSPGAKPGVTGEVTGAGARKGAKGAS